MPGGALEVDESQTTTSTTTTAATTSSSSAQQWFVGRKLQEHRGAFLLEHPMDNGMIKNWDAMEVLWEVRERAGGRFGDDT
jgi:actin-related protein